MSLKTDLVAYARSLGFERVGVTSADPLVRDEEFLKHWLAEGRAGEMGYLEDRPERRTRPAELLPGAKSVIALAMNYGDPSPRASLGPLPGERVQGEGKVARYAHIPDYHKTIGKRLESLVRYIEALAPGTECRTFVDTGPLLERPIAQRAGLGFIGKNTMLITKGLGSWVFLASVITTLDLPIDAPDERSCGECRLCIDACPTEAITAPFQLDARRCIAYLTIEHDGQISQDLRGKTEGWVFGCDICQEVCPHNARRGESDESGPSLRLGEILSIQTDEDYRKRFSGTSLMRAGRESLVRNACLAAANLGRTDLSDRLQDLAKNDSSPLVRQHARWALEKLTPSHQSSAR